MGQIGLINDLNSLFAVENLGYEEEKLSLGYKTRVNAQKNLKQLIKNVGKSRDFNSIMRAERLILENELERYANSSAMKTSIKESINGVDIASRLYEKVQTPITYQDVVENYSLSKNKKNGIPYDEARQFFKSQSVRLLNMDKSRLDKTEKSLIDARRDNIKIAEKIYIKKQQEVLGITPTLSKGKGLTL